MSFRSDEIADVLERMAPVIGVSDIVPLPTVATTERSVLRLQVPDACARSWRITLAPPQVAGATTVPTAQAWPPSVAAGNNVSWTRSSTLARIRWGYGSIMQEAEIDWRSGGTFVVHGSNVMVDVVLPANVQPLAGSGVTLRFRAMAVPCDASAQSPRSEGPSLSVDTGTIAAVGSATLLVPRFARHVRLQGPYNLAFSSFLSINFYPTSALATPLAFYQIQNGVNRSWVVWDVLAPLPIPANARWMTITNGDAVNARALIAEWLMDLG